MLERAETDLRNADRLVGHVRTTIRRSGVSTASQEYAMREDHSLRAAISGKSHLIYTTSITNSLFPGHCNAGHQTLDVQLD